jgi:hypothetical protein
VDPILWAKIGHFFATLSLAFLTSSFSLVLLVGRFRDTVVSPGETEVGSAGEHPTKG